MAPIPGYPDPKPVELSPEAWTIIWRDVHTVTISLESGILRVPMYLRWSITYLTLELSGIYSGNIISLNSTPVLNPLELRGGKPVIYLYPPSNLTDVTVELSLTSSWRLSAVHPPPMTTLPPGEPHTAQSLTWAVAVEPNGTLVDKTSGMEVSYLYWEAM